METIKRSMVARNLGVRRDEYTEYRTEVFISGENTLYDIIILCHHTFVQTVERATLFISLK